MFNQKHNEDSWKLPDLKYASFMKAGFLMAGRPTFTVYCNYKQIYVYSGISLLILFIHRNYLPVVLSREEMQSKVLEDVPQFYPR